MRRSSSTEIDLPTPFSDFRSWFTEVVEETQPQVVVCIARSALRLLQIHDAFDLLKNIRVVTQYTLAFLCDSEICDKRVLIFDDSVVYGSTLAGVYDYVVARKGLATCAAYIADRAHFFGEGSDRQKPSPHVGLPLQVKHRLSPHLVTVHHDAVIQAVLGTSLEYNPDFASASFCLAESEGIAEILPYALSRHRVIRRLFEVSSATSVKSGLHRYTGLLKAVRFPVFASPELVVGPFSKVRFFLDTKRGVLKSTALAQVRMKKSLLPSAVVCENPVAGKYWERLVFPDSRDSYWPQAMSRLATAFASTVINAVVCRDIPELLAVAHECSKPTFVQQDLDVILTGPNMLMLQAMFDEIVSAAEDIKCPIRDADDDSQSNMERTGDDQLIASIERLWVASPEYRPQTVETAFEALAKVFLALHEVTDTDALRERNPTAARLNVGLDYQMMTSLLERATHPIALDELSTALDICVDHGLAVPRVLLSGDEWHRVFYSGENRDSVDPLQFKALFYKTYVAYLKEKGAKALTPFSLNKVCATMRDLVPRLPISTKFKTFGKVAMIGSDELVSWMTSSSGAPLVHDREGDVTLLRPNPHFLTWLEPAWSPQEILQFADAFSFVATAYTHASTDAVLLLSTCRTHRHAYCAMAVEAHQWAGDGAGFGAFIEDVWRANGACSSEALFHLYYCCREIHEIARKNAIFTRRFAALKNELRRQFVRQGTAATRYWDLMVESSGLLVPDTIPEIETRATLLEPLVEQMRLLTQYTVRLLIETGRLRAESLQDTFKAQGASLEWTRFDWLLSDSSSAAAVGFNRFFARPKAVGRSWISTQIPEGYEDRHKLDVPARLDTVRHCFYELREALQQLCPRYVVAEGDEFEFAPDCSKRQLPDGTIERYLADQFVLAVDIIGSTDSDSGVHLKNNILAILDRSKSKGTKFATAGDDKYVVCHSSPQVLWDVATAIQVDGAMLAAAGGRMGGSRKGLFFGSITLQEKPDGRVLIIDTTTPHVIPRAVGTLGGASSSNLAKVLGENSVISIDYFAAQRAASALNLDVAGAERVDVQSKHYQSQCCIFPIVGTH